MNRSEYSLNDTVPTPIKSEIDPREPEEKMRNRVSNFMLKGRFDFPGDEFSHRVYKIN